MKIKMGEKMLSKVKACILQGLEGCIIDVETDLSSGLPNFNIVGLADTSIKEAKERVRASIKNSQFKFPVSRITVNLAPANLKKEGSQMDLPIAVGILSASKVIKNEIESICFIGELSLDGKITKIDGALPLVISLRNNNIKKVVIPEENKEECGVIDNIDIIPIKSLNELVDYLNAEIDVPSYKSTYEDYFSDFKHAEDFSDIKGQAALKRAIEIAAAGGHNLLMLGPPGSGKTMVARRIPSILPDLSFEESLEVTKIYSIYGQINETGLIKKRPFRSPHHTISRAALAGGGKATKPGEVSLSHHGVLFLDEMPEFPKSVLEILRQPMEDGAISIARANNSYRYPARFMLIGSMNPCPCGFLGDSKHECSCNQGQINKYLSKISGPLLDRMDIQIEVSPVYYDDLNSKTEGESSKEIKERVLKARKIQLERYKDLDIYTNSQLSPKQLDKYCKIDKESQELLKLAFDNLGLSARAYSKILKVARTIADLEGNENIMQKHIAEAIQYRSLDRKYWG